jgi:hypothetical protein
MITQAQINLYWGKKYRSDLRVKADEIAAAVQVHSRKLTPKTILDAFRPNETAEHKKYRLAVYKPKTFGWFNKVVQQYSKIRRAEDWRVEWPANVVKNPVQLFTEGNFGEYNNVTNWYFSVYLRYVVDDPNGVLIILPSNIERILTGEDRLNGSVPFKPKPFYFPSSAVREYTENLLVIDAQELERDASGQVVGTALRPVQYLFDKDQAVKIVQVGNGAQTTSIVYTYTHNIGFTAMVNGGLLAEEDQRDNRKLFWSFIEPALPFWQEAISIESDHQINLALHIHPERWEIATQTCTNKINGSQCDGGQIRYKSGNVIHSVTCPKCDGTAKVSVKTPFGVTKVPRIKVGTGDKAEYGPTPPMGYAERPIESIKIVKELADDNIFDGLAALNLEVLAQGTKLAQSGTAKAMDNQEAETFVSQFAQHSVENIITNVYYFIAAWLLPHLPESERAKLLPVINTPRKFDLVTTDMWIARVAAYKADGAAPSAQGEAEIKLAERMYGPDSTAFKRIRDSIVFDQLYGQSAEEKSLTLLGGGCSKLSYVISSQIGYFLTRAAAETSGDFYDWDFPKKVAQLVKYAQESIAPAAPLGNALDGVQADPSNPADGGDPRAALRGSVGGSSIIAALRLQVAKKLSTKEAAVAQLVIQMGYSEDEAAKMIGDPVDLEAQVKEGTVPAAGAGA